MLRRPIRARGHGYENSACVDRLDKDSSNQGQVLLVGGRTAPPRRVVCETSSGHQEQPNVDVAVPPNPPPPPPQPGLQGPPAPRPRKEGTTSHPANRPQQKVHRNPH